MRRNDEKPKGTSSVVIHPPESSGDLASFLALLAEIGAERLKREATRRPAEHQVQYDHSEETAA
jgi:hypothetical protein